jgi:geranylgeranyl pyrophosphate synthase
MRYEAQLMKKEALDCKEKEGKLLPKILVMLEAQGCESLEKAKKRAKAIGIENIKARESIEMYASNWNDYVHPALLSLSSDAVSKRLPITVDLQVMMLLQTAAMDIHDDVMDKSKMKNGKPTLFGKYGEDLAILVGDAFLMESFLMLPQFKSMVNNDTFTRICATVRKTLLEVGNAHLLELNLKNNSELQSQQIIDLIERKAAIFEGISEIGAIVGNGSKDQVDALKAGARTFGYLVMLREEFIDMFEPVELSSRLRNEYLPLPIVVSLEDPKVRGYVEAFKKGRVTEKSAHELVDIVLRNQNVKRLKETMEVRVTQTVKLLRSQRLKKKPVSSMASLIEATLEDL